MHEKIYLDKTAFLWLNGTYKTDGLYGFIMQPEINRFFLCYFEATRHCNLSCPYCMTEAKGTPQPGELSTAEIKELIIDEVAKYCSHPAMAFSGGEFLLRPDALDLLSYTSRKGMYSFINTNATLLNKKTLKNIKSAADNRVIFVFSLNSIEKKIHKWSRNDGLSTVIKAAKLCMKQKINFFFIVTISKNNLHTLKKTVDILKSQGVPVLRSPFVPRGLGRSFPELMLERDDFESIIHPVLRNYAYSYVSYTPFFASPEFIDRMQEKMNVAIGQLGCQAAKGFVGINAEGDVAPCVQMLDSDVKCGNVRNKPLLEILQHSEILNSLRTRDNLKGKCGRCRYKQTCGGCRAMAYYTTGDYLEADPDCFFEPEDENTASELEEMQNGNTAIFLDFITSHEPWSLLFKK